MSSQIGVFRDIVVSRKGARRAAIASGVIFAVNMEVRGAPGTSLDACSHGLLATMQARQPASGQGKQQSRDQNGPQLGCSDVSSMQLKSRPAEK